MSERAKDSSEPEKVKNLPISQDALDHFADERKEEKYKQDEEDTTPHYENDAKTDNQSNADEQNNLSEQKSSLKPFLWVMVVILLILIILLFSRFFLPSENPAKEVSYNGFDFKKADGDIIWYTSWERKNITHIW